MGDATIPKASVRTYRESDYNQVVRLFCHSQNERESIQSKFKSPGMWTLWIVTYSILLMTVSRWTTSLVTQSVATVVWVLVAIAVIYVGSVRIEIQNRVDEALANDLKDPDMYYLNHELRDGKKVEKKEQKQPSHFWVVTVDDEVCGMIGLSCNAEDVQDQRETLPVGWKQFCSAMLELCRLPVPLFFRKERPCTNDYDDKKRVFAHLQIPKTATITRWMVREDLRGRGISTLLVNRAITWAGEHGINRVYAMTNECCATAEHILTKRHKFILMKRYSLNFFGEYNKLFACRVKEWLEKNQKRMNS